MEAAASLKSALVALDAARFDAAEECALDALLSGFSVEALCVLGEAAWAEGRLGDGIDWYKAACASTHVRGVDELAAVRQVRLDELCHDLLAVIDPVVYGADDPGHVLAVQTCPRPYLDATVASLRAAGLDRWRGPRLLVADGYAPRVEGFETRSSTKQVGQAQTFFRLLREAAAARDFSRVTFFEDDVVLARNALDYIAAVEPICGVTAWYSSRPAPLPTSRPVFLRSSTYGFVRNVAVTLTVEAVREVLASPYTKAWSKRHEADAVYAFALKEPFGALHFPSLVQHIGDDSAVGGSAGLRAPSFIGEAVDALELRTA